MIHMIYVYICILYILCIIYISYIYYVLYIYILYILRIIYIWCVFYVYIYITSYIYILYYIYYNIYIYILYYIYIIYIYILYYIYIADIELKTCTLDICRIHSFRTSGTSYFEHCRTIDPAPTHQGRTVWMGTMLSLKLLSYRLCIRLIGI